MINYFIIYQNGKNTVSDTNFQVILKALGYRKVVQVGTFAVLVNIGHAVRMLR